MVNYPIMLDLERSAIGEVFGFPARFVDYGDDRRHVAVGPVKQHSLRTLKPRFAFRTSLIHKLETGEVPGPYKVVEFNDLFLRKIKPKTRSLQKPHVSN